MSLSGDRAYNWGRNSGGICEKLFNIVDTNKNGFIEMDEYNRVTLTIYSYLLPKSRWRWIELDEDLDDKISPNEWLRGCEAIAEFIGEAEFIAALRKWCTDMRAQKDIDETDLDAAIKQLDAMTLPDLTKVTERRRRRRKETLSAYDFFYYENERKSEFGMHEQTDLVEL